MADKFKMMDATLVVAGDVAGTPRVVDCSGFANQLNFASSFNEEDGVTIADRHAKPEAGLETSEGSFTALRDVGVADPWDAVRQMRGFIGGVQAAVQSGSAMAEGDRGVFVPGVEMEFVNEAEVLASFSSTFMGREPLIYARVHQPDTAPLAASGNSVGLQIPGGIPGGKRLWAVQFVYSGTGTLDGKMESDTDSGFATALTDRITFAQVAGEDFEYSSVLSPPAAPITDEWWRYNFTVVTGPFTVLVMAGID